MSEGTTPLTSWAELLGMGGLFTPGCEASQLELVETFVDFPQQSTFSCFPLPQPTARRGGRGGHGGGEGDHKAQTLALLAWLTGSVRAAEAQGALH